jgi:hypothetical protein
MLNVVIIRKNPQLITSSEGQVISFHSGDILMMSNGNRDTVFGGNGRKCPSSPGAIFLWIK